MIISIIIRMMTIMIMIIKIITSDSNNIVVIKATNYCNQKF